jgi:glycosyltransferase involved in cell wall biosynthesis
MAGRVLMVTARWPPHGTVGVRRPVRLARHLPRFGWTPVVLADEPARAPHEGAPTLDETIEAPPVEVHRARALFPLYRVRHGVEAALAVAGLKGPAHAFRRFTRGLLLPDHYPEWTPAVVRAARKLGPVDVVWATGMPFGSFVAAAAAAAALQRPLVLDYRDPWSQADAGELKLRHRLRLPPAAHALLEEVLLRRAAGVSYVNHDMLNRNRVAFGVPPDAVWEVIPNGFDAAELAGLEPLRGERPTLLYAGNCYGGRSMLPVLEALAAGFGPGDRGLVLEVYGELDVAAQRFLEKHPLPGRVVVSGRVGSAEIHRRLLGADALLLIIGAEHRSGLTGKIFDYLAAGRPIVGVGPPDAAAADLVERGGLGAWIREGDRQGLARTLRLIENGRLPFAPRPETWRAYTAEAMAERTARLLDRVAGR